MTIFFLFLPPKNIKANYEFRISEGAYDHVKIGEILASDGDLGANAEIEFEIPKSEQKIPDLVQIDGKDGTLYLDGHLDRETMSAIAFEVVARDRAHVQGDLDENINESRYLFRFFP